MGRYMERIFNGVCKYHYSDNNYKCFDLNVFIKNVRRS